MKNQASLRSALIMATGLFVCFASPSQAATGADDAAPNSRSETAVDAPVTFHRNLGHGTHHRKSYAHRKFHKVALKPANDRRAAASFVARNSAVLSDLPPSVANANAQLPFLNTSDSNARAMSARASNLLQAMPDNPANADNEILIAAADQLNDLDRALRETNAPGVATSAAAPVNPPVVPVAANSQDTSAWNQTSLIGKIFIGFGALLTMASAARMFMA